MIATALFRVPSFMLRRFFGAVCTLLTARTLDPVRPILCVRLRGLANWTGNDFDIRYAIVSVRVRTIRARAIKLLWSVAAPERL